MLRTHIISQLVSLNMFMVYLRPGQHNYKWVYSYLYLIIYVFKTCDSVLMLVGSHQCCIRTNSVKKIKHKYLL